jgi:hypothetical protein
MDADWETQYSKYEYCTIGSYFYLLLRAVLVKVDTVNLSRYLGCVDNKKGKALPVWCATVYTTCTCTVGLA